MRYRGVLRNSPWEGATRDEATAVGQRSAHPSGWALGSLPCAPFARPEGMRSSPVDWYVTHRSFLVGTHSEVTELSVRSSARNSGLNAGCG